MNGKRHSALLSEFADKLPVFCIDEERRFKGNIPELINIGKSALRVIVIKAAGGSQQAAQQYAEPYDSAHPDKNHLYVTESVKNFWNYSLICYLAQNRQKEYFFFLDIGSHKKL